MAERITQDPESYSGGYVPAWAVRDPADGKWKFMPLMGHNHAPNTNNAVRVFDPDTLEWSYWQQDLSSQLSAEQWFAGEDTDPPSASGRNNTWGWYLPWRDWLVIGAPGDSLAGNHGVFDLTQQAWVHLVPNDQRKDFVPTITYSVDAEYMVTRWNAADAVCGPERALIRYGGSNHHATLFVAYEQDNGSFHVDRHDNQSPGTRNAVQQQGVCRGEYFYLAGGEYKYGGDPLAQFWRCHIPTVKWERMADLPAPVAGGAILLHDSDHDRIVCIANDGTANAYVWNPNDDTWADAGLGLPTCLRCAGAYVPGHGIFLRGGEFDSDGWQSSNHVYKASLGPVDDTTDGGSTDDGSTDDGTNGDGSTDDLVVTVSVPEGVRVEVVEDPK